MTKDELIARLQVLGEQLNRDVSLTGTKEELALRVAELEEELDDTDDAAGQDTSVSPENALTGHENEVVCVAGRLRANLPVVGPYCLRNRTALNRTPTAPAHPVRIWGRKPHRRLITALNPRITPGRIRTV